MSNILGNILDVFSGVADWIVEAVTGLIPMFYTAPTAETEGGLTIIGVLAVASLAISVSLLIFNLIRSMLRFE